MYWTSFSAALFLMVLSGCAASSASPSLPDNHPASPAAASSPLPARSVTLAMGFEPSVDTGDHSSHQSHETPTAAGQPVYVCPMHPEVTSLKPDDRCPKCKMKLKVKPATQPGTHPSVIAVGDGRDHASHDQPAKAIADHDQSASARSAGGHDAAIAAAPATQSADVVHVCPMHPEVTSIKADDRCPKCNMKLKVKPATSSSPATAPVAPPAGHHHGGH